jgi:hypothetical protein
MRLFMKPWKKTDTVSFAPAVESLARVSGSAI